MKARCALVKSVVVFAFLLWAWRGAVSQAADTYEVGGPLQGVSLPLFPTQHGEKPGYPGCIPELQKPDEKGNAPFTSEGLPPERQLYDGSVEHFRAYYFKYLPVKSSFDRQSLVKNWPAQEISGVSKDQMADYAEPVYWVPRHREVQFTGMTNKPAPVVRCKPNAPVFSLNLGALAPGLYCLRVIGAVETQALQRHRKPMYLRLTVNDGSTGLTTGGSTGGKTVYRLRCPYVDEFYRVAEFYFNAPEKRDYAATLTMDEGSLADLLVYNIELHNALAGADFRAIKTRSLTPPTAAGVKPPTNDEARRTRDAALWNAFPPLNAQTALFLGMGKDDPQENWPNFGCGGLTPAQIEEAHGKWVVGEPLGDVLLTNAKLKLTYTIADLKAGRPLPDPYPYKDTGCGIYTPAAKTGENPQNWYPVAQGVQAKMNNYIGAVSAKTKLFREKNDAAAGRDAALMLCRVASQYPAITTDLALHSIVIQPSAYGRDMGCRRRDLRQYLLDVDFLWDYDRLFDFIQADAGLAESVGRFVPWVKTPKDVVRLIDTYLVQDMAKRCMRYQMYNSSEPARILGAVQVMADNAVTTPWMEWLFSSTFIYPLPPTGLQDIMITGNDRDGIGPVGSYFYALGQQAAPQAAALEDYILNGGNPKYDLRDQKRFPTPVAACYFYLNSLMAGQYFPRIGDVTGPDKYYAQFFDGNSPQWRYGWRWTHDPKFAFVIRNFGKRGKETDAEWAAIEAAAATVKRAPWLETRSRVLSNWFGLLETGIQFDDPRFRRDVYLRIGMGWGHAHADTLDLQGHAHGYPFTIDGGQRNGYSTPGDSKTYVHNLVQVDGSDWRGHSWVETLNDSDGARYLSARAEPPLNHTNVSLYRRQVALIDVDQGGLITHNPPAEPVGILPKETVSPNAYILDIVRVAGGKLHRYCFHGPIEDELVTTVKNKVGADKVTEMDKALLDKFGLEGKKSAGDAQEIVEATWRMTREKGYNEQRMAGAIWNEASPRKYTRLHVLGQKGSRVLTGALQCNAVPYSFTSLFIQRRSEVETDAVFSAIIEPYVGDPFITSRRLLSVRDNENNALRAVALEVKTKNGRTDLLFADGCPEKTREVRGLKSAVSVSGEFAYYSTDQDGLRQATLAGGRLLQTPAVTLKPAARERTGKVIRADYAGKTMVIDQAWPAAALLNQCSFEIGTTGRMTTYTIGTAKAEAKTTRLTVTGGAVLYLSRVSAVKAETRQVQCVLAMSQTTKEDPRPCPGLDKHWVAANEKLTKFWRADYLGPDAETGNYVFQLDGAVTEADFGQAGGFCLLEYGVGDTVRQSTGANLRRVQPAAGDKPAVYELTADVDVEVTVNGKTRTVMTDELAKSGGRIQL